jgi:hypothetical protein
MSFFMFSLLVRLVCTAFAAGAFDIERSMPSVSLSGASKVPLSVRFMVVCRLLLDRAAAATAHLRH